MRSGLSAVRVATLATAMRTRSMAFSVAASGCWPCTQAFWLRMLAISTRYSLMPADLSVLRNSGSCVRGVQAATTMRFRPRSRICWTMRSWVSWAQVNRLRSTCTTCGRVAA